MSEWRLRLPHSFGAFFGLFAHLMPVQEQGLLPILAGRDVLLAAPTASGKTETFAAPAAEMVFAAPKRKRALAFFVSPTRALANDLKRRLEARYGQLGVGFGRYTGEHKERIGGGLPEVCVTTPEALDSLLARRSGALADLRLVVLDEIHVLDGTPRGDQLRVLLQRLELLARRRPQRVAASATIQDPKQVAARYLKDPAVISVEATRPLRARAFSGRSPEAMGEHLAFLARHGFKKILVFCNRRKDVEDYATKLKSRTIFGQALYPHHGSLARRERERVEQHFLQTQAAVVFATLTLELGIDIGSVDYVLLAAPPPDVSSLLQRVGRGGRRAQGSRAGYLVESPGDEHLFQLLFGCGSRGRLLAPAYSFRPGVLVQQALVLGASRGWVSAEDLWRAVPKVIWQEISPLGPVELLASMHSQGLLEAPRGGRFALSGPSEQRYERGVLHSNIDDQLTLDVVDRLTGDVIGHLPSQESRRLSIAGGGRQVVHEGEGRILTDRVGFAGAAHFEPRGSPCCSFAQGRAVVESLGVKQAEIWLVAAAGTRFLLHGLGTPGALLLSLSLQKLHGRAFLEGSSPYVLRLSGELKGLPALDLPAARAIVQRHGREFTRLLNLGPHQRHLPSASRLDVCCRAAGLAALVDFLGSARLVTRPKFSRKLLACVQNL